MRKIIILIAVLGLAGVSAGCETIKGVGRDITNTSGAVENAFSSRGK